MNISRLDEIQSENMKLKVDNTKLSRKVDTIKNENQNVNIMEQEKASLKQTVAQMKATIENMKKTQAKQVGFETPYLLKENNPLFIRMNWRLRQ